MAMFVINGQECETRDEAFELIRKIWHDSKVEAVALQQEAARTKGQRPTVTEEE